MALWGKRRQTHLPFASLDLEGGWMGRLVWYLTGDFWPLAEEPGAASRSQVTWSLVLGGAPGWGALSLQLEVLFLLELQTWKVVSGISPLGPHPGACIGGPGLVFCSPA